MCFARYYKWYWVNVRFGFMYVNAFVMNIHTEICLFVAAGLSKQFSSQAFALSDQAHSQQQVIDAIWPQALESSFFFPALRRISLPERPVNISMLTATALLFYQMENVTCLLCSRVTIACDGTWRDGVVPRSGDASCAFMLWRAFINHCWNRRPSLNEPNTNFRYHKRSCLLR